MINREAAIIVTITAIMISIPVTFAPGGSGFISRDDSPEVVIHRPVVPRLECWKGDGDVAVSGANIYTIWECYNHILFAKSNDGGKTFANTTLVSGTPNTNPKTSVLNDNVSISASGNNVAIMWDTNKTGIPNPVIRASSDGGNTFGDIVTLNSTSGGVNK